MFMQSRREAITLIVIAALFVLAGGFLIATDKMLLGLVAIVFFGSGMVVGIHQLVRPGEMLSPAIAIIGALGFTATGVLLVAAHFLGANLLGRYQVAALPIGIITVLFFGGGAVLLIIRQLRRKNRGDVSEGENHEPE